MNIMKKIVALLLVAAMCISFTACGDDGIAMEINGEEIPAGVYILQQISALNSATQSEEFDSTLKDIWDNELEGKSLAEWVKDEAMKDMQIYGQVEKMFDEYGLTLSEDDLNAIAYTVETYWPNYESTYQKVGISKSSYELYETNNYKYQKLFLYYYGENGTEPVSDDELKEYYSTDFAQFQMIAFSTLNRETYEEMESADKAKVKATAQSYLDRAKNGEDMVDLINERTIEYAAETDQETPEIDESATYITTVKKDTSSYYVSDTIRDEVFSNVDIGEIVLLTDDSGYYVVKRLEVSTDTEDFEDLRDSLLSELKSEDFLTVVTDLSSEITLDLHDSSIKRYKVKKLDKIL